MNPVDRNRLIVLLGPTASGKTEVSLHLAGLLPIEIISADSRQVYEYLDIGTAKPNKKYLDSVPHHFISIIKPDNYYSAGIFAGQAENVIDEIIRRNRIPIVVGGSGLYIKALCEGLFEESSLIDHGKLSIRSKIEHQLKNEGIESLYKDLLYYDPISAAKYSDMNPRRIVRALEYYYSSGIQISVAQLKSECYSSRKIIYFGIRTERNELYERINLRTEFMWSDGLVEETKSILSKGYSPQLNSLNTVGYKEALAFLSGKLSEDEAIDKMKQSTRNYAKRQVTWFKKVPGVIWMSGDPDVIAKKILSHLNNM